MATNSLKIGIVGGYVSGKATFLNALLKFPCFSMRSNSHNRLIVEIRRADEGRLAWEYMDEGVHKWSKSKDDIRCDQSHRRIRVRVPHFLWGNSVFYDFPQINDLGAWGKVNCSFVEKMDFIFFVFDAEYAMSEANKKAMAYLASFGKVITLIPNKSDIIDNIDNLASQVGGSFAGDNEKCQVFAVSSKLELQRWTSPQKRMTSFAFTESRRMAMRLCDLAFSDLRSWLYEKISSLEHSENIETED